MSEKARQQAQKALPLTSDEARQQAQAEGLTLRVAESRTGYFGVKLQKCLLNRSKPKPYQARVNRCGEGTKDVYLGYFATAEEAALCVARSPEGQAAAQRAAAAPAPLTKLDPNQSEEARQQAQAEKLTLLRVAESKASYLGARVANPGRPKPYQAQV